MAGRTYNVLFLCTGNSVRSLLAEAVLNNFGQGRFRAHGAGRHPTGRVNPFALDGAPPLDFVFTVCDSAAGEACPVWPRQPITAHWGVADPAAVEGSDEAKGRAFLNAFQVRGNRNRIVASVRLESLDRLAIGAKVREIGKLTAPANGQPA